MTHFFTGKYEAAFKLCNILRLVYDYFVYGEKRVCVCVFSYNNDCKVSYTLNLRSLPSFLTCVLAAFCNTGWISHRAVYIPIVWAVWKVPCGTYTYSKMIWDTNCFLCIPYRCTFLCYSLILGKQWEGLEVCFPWNDSGLLKVFTNVHEKLTITIISVVRYIYNNDAFIF